MRVIATPGMIVFPRLVLWLGRFPLILLFLLLENVRGRALFARQQYHNCGAAIRRRLCAISGEPGY